MLVHRVVAGALMAALLAFAQSPTVVLADAKADTCSGHGTPQAVVAACTALIETGGGSASNLAGIYIDRANAYDTLGRHARAIQDYDRAIALEPNLPAAYYNRGMAYEALEERDRALADFTHAIALRADDWEALGLRGYLYESMGAYGKALSDFNTATSVAGDKAVLLTGRALAYEGLQSYGPAIDDFTSAIRLQPSPLAYSGRGHVEFFTGRYLQAARDFAQIVAQAPTYAYAVIWEDLSFARAGRSDPRFAHNVAALNPKAWPAPVVKLFLGTATPQDVEAAATSGDATSLQGQRCEAAFYVGEWYVLHGQTNAARDRFARAKSVCPHTFSEYFGALAELGRDAP